jgi:hypothetical protein
LGRGGGQGGEVAADIVRGTGVLIDDDFGDHLGRDELRQGARGFAPIIRLRIVPNLGTEPILGMRRRRRHDDLHIRRWFREAGDENLQRLLQRVENCRLKILPNPLRDGRSIDRLYIFGDY